jgi:hypothetical protein
VPRVRVTVRRRTSFTSNMSVAYGPDLSGANARPQRLAGVTREDGGYALLVDDPGEATVSVETLDGTSTLASRATTVPDADAHVIDIALAGVAVSGLVVDDATGKPLPDARVSAMRRGRTPGSDALPARTGPDGRFTLEAEPGEYRLYASAEAYTNAVAEVTVGEAGAADVRIGLAQGASIAGRVLDAQGRPAAGARVSVTEAGTGRWRPSQLVAVLSDGSFRIDGLERQPYTVLAGSTQGFALRTDIEAGTKDLVLALQPGGKARVEVVGPDGAPVSGARVSLAQAGGVHVMSPIVGASTDPQGVAVLDLPAGPVEVLGGLDSLMLGRAATTVPAGGTVAVRLQLASRREAPRP